LIKVYKGTALVVENPILDVPVSMCINIEQATGPRHPTVAVASGSYIFMYRQLRPFKKWSCPYVEISPVETDIWNNLTSDDINFSTAHKMLSDARDAGTILSSKSAEFLSLENEDVC
jgi:Bardet-Biedl syndrome 1 protein